MAKFGLFEKSLKLVKGFFVKGIATKADYASSTNTRTDRETFMLKLFRLNSKYSPFRLAQMRQIFL